MKRASLEQDLADAEEQIASGQRRIAGQRQVIAELEHSRLPTDYAKYLLSGLELLQAAHRDARNRLLRELGKADSHPYSTSRTYPKAKKGVEGLTEAELLPTNRICGSGKGR
jgi:hypothetical protein